MATFADIIKADRDAILLNTNDFGREITYTPISDPGNPVTINAVISYGEVMQEQLTDGDYMVYTAKVTIANDADSGVVAPFPSNDTVTSDYCTFDGEDWYLSSFTPNGNSQTHALQVFRRVLITKRRR